MRIVAATFNPIDLKLTSGHMRQIRPLHFPFVPGADFSGVVDLVGNGVNDHKPGDEAFGYSPAGGAYAEYIAIDADKIARKPRKLSYIDAASLALVASFARLKEYGANRVIDYKTERFEDYAKNVHAVLDVVGGEVQQRSFSVLKPGGVLIAISQPPSEEEAKKHQVKALMFSTEGTSENLRKIAQLADAGEIKPFIGKTYPRRDAAQAWHDARTGKFEGKLAFQVAADANQKSQKASAS